MTAERAETAGGQVLLETGVMARQASGSVTLSAGDTTLLAVVTADRKVTALPYMPLTTEYRLRYAAAGAIPGNYDRREARPSEDETLTSRLVDRSIRPLFPDAWPHDTQVVAQPLSYEPGTDPAVLAITAASAALSVSDIPWSGPVAGVRIARVDGALVAFPTGAQRGSSDLDLVVSVTREGIVMLEGGADEAGEDIVLSAFALAREAAEPLLAAQERLAAAAAPARRPVPEAAGRPELEALVRRHAETVLREALSVDDKLARHRALEAAAADALARVAEEAGADARDDAASLVRALEKELVRSDLLEGRRIGGRGLADVRAISGRAGWLPRCHGSSLFTRGETQVMVTCTLGSEREARSVDTLDGRQRERFLLHYNFPPYSVGEVRPLRLSRREIGHGHLARRALLPVLPGLEEAPYTIRLEATVTESNGSSSMATACGGTLALLDAGLALRRPVAGVAMGLVKEGDRAVVLTDILGDEDHVGDMDFKVCGTERGITAIQLDNKLGAVPEELMRRALDQAREGRLHVLGAMASILDGPRDRLHDAAPRVETIRIEPNRVRDVIGAGGRTIRALEQDYGVKVDVDDSGVVRLYGTGAETLMRARDRVRDLTGIPRVGEASSGVVVSVQPFGSFVRLFEGIEGLLPGESLPVSSRVTVKVAGVTDRGKIELRRA